MQRPARPPSEPNAADAGARYRFRHVALPIVVTLALGVAVLLAVAWAVSSRAVVRALDYAVAQSGGRLSYEGASGSLTGRVAVDRIAWQDGATRIVAERVAATLAPRALLQWRAVLAEVEAARIAVDLPPGDGKDIPLPASLALPLAVSVDAIRIGRIDWKAGAKAGTIDGVALGYSGDRAAHRVRDLDVRIAGARLAGAVELAATSPFALAGKLALELAAPYPAGHVETTLGGTLGALDVDARGSVADVAGEARVRLVPLAAQPLVDARVAARALDVARFGAGWPATRVDVAAFAKPAPGGYAGTIEATNAMPGTLDAGRLPLAHLAADVALADDTLALDAVSAQTGDGASIRGSGTVDVRTGHSRWQLAVRNLDLARLHRSLVPTRLGGSLDADVRENLQRLRGEVRQQDMRLAFDASYDGREIVASRLVAEARGGEVSGTGRIALDRAKRFSLDARARRFDPSRFGAFPAGALDGTVAARGTLEPLAVDADVVAAPGSRFAGLPAHGRLQGRFTRTEVASLDADVVLGATKVAAEGGYGRSGGRLVVRLASKRLDELATLVPGAPRPLGGAVDARVTIEGLERAVRVGFDVKADRLAIGDEYASAKLALDGTATVAAPLLPARLEALSAVELDVRAAGLRTPAGTLESAHAHLAGAAAGHAIAFDAVTGQGRVEGRLAGALTLPPAGTQWRGRVESLAVRDIPGFAPVALAAAVEVGVGPDRLDVGRARVESGSLRADIDAIEWRAGAFASRGRFRGLPVAPMLAQAGLEARWPTDLMLKGEWDLASTPAWRGTLRIARESGDVYVYDPADDGASRIALGLDTVAIDARLDGPRILGTGELRGRFGGDALADFAIAAPPGSGNPFAGEAPLRASVRAHVPSLAWLQPWLGTSARLQGQAIADVDVTGVLGKPVLAGQLVGYGLRLDMPQYGVNWRDGRLRVASGPEGIVLEEFEIAGGAGRFVASGTIALPRDGAASAEASRIAWRAEDFRALNRPDMRVVVDGEGTLATVGRRLVLKGKLKAEDGNFEYRSAADTTLADDIVVVGRPRQPRGRAADAAIGDTPVELDLTLDLGRDLRFAAEGLDTRLAGRLRVTSRPDGGLEGRGTIRTLRGTYWAFGQKLDIDRGRVIFDGPLANPSLDVVALRRNLAVEAGVEITGNVRAPLVRLTSNPPVPDSEKLSWLLTGGPSGSTSAKEAAALSAATAALVGRGGKSITQQVAQSIGLDEISVGQRTSGAGPNALEGQVLTVGKRLTDRVYVAYEQGLTIATNALRIEYVLSRYFTVSAFTGTSSGIGINFRRNWR